jgi:hypothetical protein
LVRQLKIKAKLSKTTAKNNWGCLFFHQTRQKLQHAENRAEFEQFICGKKAQDLPKQGF